MPLEAERIHPRPQLTRARWRDLCGDWDFAYDDTAKGLAEDWQQSSDAYTRKICVPFPPESPASGVGETAFHPIIWYRRTFSAAPVLGERLLLHCGAVDYRARVWVNGQLVAMHEGGNTPFSADITEVLKPNDEQIIVIRAEDYPTDLAQPRGKQDWQEQPHTIWYHRTTGIWQPVWLEPVAETHIESARWTPDLLHRSLTLALKLKRSDAHREPLYIRVQLHLHGVTLADDTCLVQGTYLQREFRLHYVAHEGDSSKDVLWSPEHPNLIDVDFTVIENENIVDEVQSYAGLRSVGIANKRFLLNGSPYYLRLVLEQGYWPESHLTAPSDEAIRREVELVKELGFNGVRIHQKVEDPRFLYWCDRLGVLVWGEMANAYVFSNSAVERFIREWLEVLARDYSHPCIVTWVPLNESWGVPELAVDSLQQHYVQTLYHLTKALDPTRPVIGNDGWEHIISDITSIHDYTFDGKTLRQRYGSIEALDSTLREIQPLNHDLLLPGYQPEQQPVIMTEYGGISYKPQQDTAWFGYGTVTDDEAYLTKYRELTMAILDSPAIAGFCYTQLTDTGQETNGLLTDKREFKIDASAIRAINQHTSAAVPSEIAVVYRNEASK